MAYIEGVDRHQVVLFPEALDDYVAANSTVRVIDAFVAGLDLKELGFRRAVPAEEGAPGYDPRSMLALYIYGYLNRTRSSRRLEAETHRNLEVIWLMRKLRPDHKTIAEFRRVHSKALQQVTLKFVKLCRDLELLDGTLVFIDGTKLRALNSRERNYTPTRAARMLREIEASIAKYHSELDRQDRQEEGTKGPTDPDLPRKLEALKARQKELQEIQKQIERTGEQVSLTDPDSRMMTTRKGVEVGYNAQIAVDAKHGLIVAQAVTNEGNDQEQLGPMALAAKEILAVETLEVAADCGYHSPAQIAVCEANGITPYVPETQTTSNSVKAGLFTKEEFTYSETRDAYQCPAGNWLDRRSQSRTKSGRILGYYTNPPACRSCPLRVKCTRDKYARRIIRRPEEAQVAAMRKRLAEHPEMMIQRKRVEPPFGTLKRGMDMGYFLLKGLERVNGEFSLSTLGYNLKRVINLLGVECLLEGLKKQKELMECGLQTA